MTSKKQTDSAKTPRKPRTKKDKLPKPFTAEELAESYRSIPAADLEPLDECPTCKTHQSLCKCANRLQGTKEPHTGSMDAMGRLGTSDPASTNEPKQVFSATNTERTTEPREPNNPQQPAPTNTDSPSQLASSQTPQTDTDTSAGEAGDVPLSVAESGLLYGTASLAREETRAQASNRWILEGRRWETDRRRQDLIRQHRAAGLTREQAADRAWEACLAEFPPPGTDPGPAEKSPIGDEFPEAAEQPKPEAAPPAPQADVGEIRGLEMPESWGTLPANAPLQVEISWVSANRLRVRSGNGVDLSRALSPAPSYSALSWLETSILFPSKFADISVKATAQQDDEREGIRREKLAIEEIRSLLAEMLEG